MAASVQWPTETDCPAKLVINYFMVAISLILGGGLKIADQNNWGGGGAEQKIKFGEGGKFKGGPRI